MRLFAKITPYQCPNAAVKQDTASYLMLHSSESLYAIVFWTYLLIFNVNSSHSCSDIAKMPKVTFGPNLISLYLNVERNIIQTKIGYCKLCHSTPSCYYFWYGINFERHVTLI